MLYREQQPRLLKDWEVGLVLNSVFDQVTVKEEELAPPGQRRAGGAAPARGDAICATTDGGARTPLPGAAGRIAGDALGLKSREHRGV